METSLQYRKKAFVAIIAISIFFVSYLIMLLSALAMVIGFLYGFIWFAREVGGFIPLLVGLGFSSMAILVLIFLIKFFFQWERTDLSHMIEIKKDDEPDLFGLIEEITQKTGAGFPKRVYLSAEVNASVFYDSSFWSMFFPVRKNIQIGMGLINCVTQQELKAVIAHEFGHFSQKSMKLGSYVYNTNQVIYNLLHNNDAYDKLLSKGAKLGVLSLFFAVAESIVGVIKGILQGLYAFVNKAHLSLSREMEFHADSIAVSVTGFVALKQFLLRFSLMETAFQSTFALYGKLQQESNETIVSENLYEDQFFVLQHIARQNELKFHNGLPQVYLSDLEKFPKSKLKFEDQWASHPSIMERINRFEKANDPLVDYESPRSDLLLRNRKKYQEVFTKQLFVGEKPPEFLKILSNSDFNNAFEDQFGNDLFPSLFNGYYDEKDPFLFDVAAAASQPITSEINQADTTDPASGSRNIREKNSNASNAHCVGLNDLFGVDKVSKVKTLLALESDLQMLYSIQSKNTSVKDFEYDGRKYKRNSASLLVKELEQEAVRLKKEIEVNDADIFKFFLNLEKSGSCASRLQSLYDNLFANVKEYDRRFDLYLQLSQGLDFINYNTPIDQIPGKLLRMTDVEANLKNEIRNIMQDDLYQPEIAPPMRENFELYLSKEWEYFGMEAYIDENLAILYSAMNDYLYLIARGFYLHKKKLLNYQAELANMVSES